MKTRNIIAILATLPLLLPSLTACSSDDVTEAKPAKEMLIVEGGAIELLASEQDKSVQVTADCHWRVSYDRGDFSDKLTVQPSEGRGNGTLVIHTDENTTLVNRQAVVTLTTDGGLQQKITISQSSSDSDMALSAESFSFSAVPGGVAQQLTLASNISWTIQLPAGIDWLHVDKTSGDAGAHAINITADEVQSDEERSATFTILYGSKNRQVQVTQAGKTNITLSVSTNELDYFAPNGGVAQVVRVTSNGAWRVFIPTSVQSWLRAEPMEGVGNGEFRVFCEQNPSTDRERLSLLIVTAGSRNPQQEDILVQQVSAGYPSVYELQLLSNSSETATLSYEFTSGSDVEEYGLCYSTTNPAPTIADEHVILGSGYGTLVEGSIAPLTERTTYYVRGYVTSTVTPQVTLYTNTVTFTTQSTSGAPIESDNINPQLSRRR
ncbi:MAG: BACON domain-containing protein [Prevotella sp.]|nr:BACON domain-containing protein [Prevotella sp.]